MELRVAEGIVTINRQQSPSDFQSSFMDRDHWWWLTDHRFPWKAKILFELCDPAGVQSTHLCHNESAQPPSLLVTRPESVLRLKAPQMMGRPRHIGKNTIKQHQ